MDKYTMDEMQYKNGFADGYQKGLQDAVKHGRWRWGRNSMNQYGAWCTECECGWEDKGNDFDRVQGLVIAHKYCPNCGARMDAGERRAAP